MTKNKKYYNIDETCKKLKISRQTLNNWYRWEMHQLKDGIVTAHYLPIPMKDIKMRGKPRYWDDDMIDILKVYKKSMIIGRNGKFGKFTNPSHKLIDKP